MTTERQSSALAPAQPTYIFRGHNAHIHSVQLLRQNRRLLTADADGWLVCWSLESKRPVAVWRAHDAAILGTAEWASDKVITHGRDNALRIWQLRFADEQHLSTVLPADGLAEHRPKPWLLHTLPVNTLNFCAFSMCYELEPPPSDVQCRGETRLHATQTTLNDSVLVAVPARDDKKIDIYRFPDEKLLHVVQRVESTDTGMVMAVKLAQHRHSKKIIVIAGYEGGFTAVHLLALGSRDSSHTGTDPMPQVAQLIYLSQPHAQPVLSLDASPDAKFFFTSSADAIIAAHQVPDISLNFDDTQSGQGTSTKETLSSIQPNAEGLTLNHEESLPLTFSKSSLESKPESPSNLSFSKQQIPTPQPSSSISTAASKPSGLSSLFSSVTPQSKSMPTAPSLLKITVQPPFKSVQTKHAGQQSLHVRSDGRLLVTGGWDSRVRIYSAKTLKEVAVLKWHKEGVYATAFGEILDHDSLQVFTSGDVPDGQTSTNHVDVDKVALTTRANEGLTGLGKLQKQRERDMQMKHWVVAGAKDGKVSLWNVF